MNVNMLIYLMVFLPMAGAVLSFGIGRKTKQGRDYVMCGIAVLEFLLSLLLVLQYERASGMVVSVPYVCGMGLHFTLDGFRGIYACIASFMWMMTSLFSVEYFGHYRNRNRYYLFLLLTLGATVAIFLSADLYTTFIFFEIMSFASYVWVAQDERKASLRAAGTYLAVAVIGGLVMLMGLFLLYAQAGTLEISKLYEACQGKNVYAACLCLLFGFGAKAGAFPLHIWLPKAHPVAPAPASALLSGILTKTGIFGILVISCQILYHDPLWGTFMLLIGVVTMFAGALLAVFSVDFKRTLACSSVSQIGFILVGVGMQGLLGEANALAVRGTFLHMMNHSLFKLLLFMVAGVIYMNLHKLDLNAIRGFGRKKPLLAYCYLMGALGIGGIPMWNGYVSKTLLHESIVEYIHEMEHGMAHGTETLISLNLHHMQAIEWIFLLSGGLTVAYMCKLFVAVFVEKNSDPELQKKYDAKKPYMNPVSAAVLTICASILPILGCNPHLFMDKLADMSQEFMGLHHPGHAVHYYAWINLKGGVISIAIGAMVYLLIVRRYLMKKTEDGRTCYMKCWPKWMDIEEAIYRPILLNLLPGIFGFLCRILDHLTDTTVTVLLEISKFVTGVMDVAVDGAVVFLRKTVYKDIRESAEPDEGNVWSMKLGAIWNSFENLLNKTIWKQAPHKKDFVHQFALVYEAIKENIVIVGRSLSYGLLLFCVGLCAVLIYLLMVAVQ